MSVAELSVTPDQSRGPLGPIDSIKRSLAILKKTWGESLGGKLSLGLMMLLLWLPGLLVAVVGAVLCVKAPALGVPLVVLGLIGLLLMCAVSSAGTRSGRGSSRCIGSTSRVENSAISAPAARHAATRANRSRPWNVG